ncbi:hypothetical protein PIB30_088998 [Stylosanthes scabra]|uniref:Uncharacterized protein n=1 Tax=Stylosanthes scabra TaxID=79078 RepID=A0ABU6XQV2_9FABA|nr:hypothetical protein [Stylosanthes scabra]
MRWFSHLGPYIEDGPVHGLVRFGPNFSEADSIGLANGTGYYSDDDDNDPSSDGIPNSDDDTSSQGSGNDSHNNTQQTMRTTRTGTH